MKKWLFSPTRVASLLIATSSLTYAQQVETSTSLPLLANQQGKKPVPRVDRMLHFSPIPKWGALPPGRALGSTHGGVAADKRSNIYASTNGDAGILVFSRSGRFLRSMAPEFAGTHCLTVAELNGTEYLYGVHLRSLRAFKMTLDGKLEFILPFPKEAGIYGPTGQGFKPTAIAVAPDGSMFVADGYGTSYIHKYTPAGQYLGSFGGEGRGPGKFMNCYGLTIDSRYGTPFLLVCDHGNRRLQYFTLDGQFVSVMDRDFGRPTSTSIFKGYLAVAELEGQVTILDKNNKPVAYVGDNRVKAEWGNFKLAKNKWRQGVLVAPHGVVWDRVGGLYIQEWSLAGRIVKFEKEPAKAPGSVVPISLTP